MAKTPLEIASLARMHTKKAVKTLAAIMNEPHAPYRGIEQRTDSLFDPGGLQPFSARALEAFA
jgi:hypothetical protein